MSKTIYLAGSTSYTAQAVLAQPSGFTFRLHLRPDSPKLSMFKGDDRAAVVDLEDPNALADSMKGCDALLCLIGTIRARFKKENVNYRTVDYEVTKKFLDAAKAAGLPHFVLMSAVGAEKMPGPYMKAKLDADRYLMQSGLGWNIVRPSFLVGGERRFVPGVGPLMAAMSNASIMTGLIDWRPIPIDMLAWNYLRIIAEGPTNSILTGRHLWKAWRDKQSTG